MIRDFDQWNSSFSEVGELQELQGCRVGIEAADYLRQRILNHARAREPLVPALGGLPLGLRQLLEEDLDTFARLQIEPRFVFGGLDMAQPDDPFRQRQEEAAVNVEAWDLYDNHQAELSVQKFGQSKYVTPEDLFRALQSVLVARKIWWEVAPYSAAAQLAYMERDRQVHCVSASSDILLFECDKFITEWDLEASHFYFTRRAACFADLEKFAGSGTISEDVFVDALMLAGSSFLSTLPSLDTPNRTDLLKPHAAIKIIMSNGRTGYSAVMNTREHPRFGDYLDRYRKARLVVRTHPVFDDEGDYKPANSNAVPNNAHEYLGARLPNEVYYAMAQGLINSRFLQWRASCEVHELPPMDGGESPEYRRLVSSTIIPLRTTAFNLISSALHNWYRHNDLKLKCWFPDPTGQPLSSIISMRDLPDTATVVDTWNVKEATFKDAVAQYPTCGHLGAAILVLQNTDFVPKTVGKKVLKNPLSSLDEIVYNSIWRFLAARDYVDASHNLTQWGKVLATVIASLKGKADLEEAAVLAVELLRLGLLNGDINMFPSYNGAPMRGEPLDRDAAMLISRVAGLGTLQHKPIGFTGPLSQHLLGYNSMVNVVSQALRDLVEVTATHMFLTACCDRLVNLREITVKLPFLLPNNCALGIAAKSYLDELLSNGADPTAIATKTRAVETATFRYFPQSENLPGDLQTAFALWDALYKGVAAGGSAVPEASKSIWAETNTWLTARR